MSDECQTMSENVRQCQTNVRQMSENVRKCQTNVRQMSENVRQMSNKCQTNFRKCLKMSENVRQMSNKFQTNVRLMSDKFKKFSGKCQTYVREMLDSTAISAATVAQSLRNRQLQTYKPARSCSRVPAPSAHTVASVGGEAFWIGIG